MMSRTSKLMQVRYDCNVILKYKRVVLETKWSYVAIDGKFEGDSMCT